MGCFLLLILNTGRNCEEEYIIVKESFLILGFVRSYVIIGIRDGNRG